jgi:hypothetical protein
VLGAALAPVRAEDQEGEQQGDGQERGPVALRRDRVEDPVDREQDEARAEHVDHRVGGA